MGFESHAGHGGTVHIRRPDGSWGSIYISLAQLDLKLLQGPFSHRRASINHVRDNRYNVSKR
jgi:hypothetical protein